MKISTNWLKDFVAIKPPMDALADALTMAGLEVKKIDTHGHDSVFEIEITSNRPDWLSHWGVAREISAVKNLVLKSWPKAVRKAPASQARNTSQDGWRVVLRDLEGCPYYTGVYIEGITPNPTPLFMRERLEACGMRSIHLLVDITNYVLLELGQPLHAFDADLLESRQIIVRKARPGETFFSISGKEVPLAAKDIVIADKERPIALAGIMGGRNSEISDRTRNVFLESAFFNPRLIRQSSRRHELSSDSSYRFERRVDPLMVDGARERALDLIREYAKPRFIGSVLIAGKQPSLSKTRIHFGLSDIEKNLGIKIKSSQTLSMLKRLGFGVKLEGAEKWTVLAPSYRPDVTRPIDLVEEVARIYGYDQIPETLPLVQPSLSAEEPVFRMAQKARDLFVGMGFYETVTFSLISEDGLAEAELKDAVKIHNPQNAELVWLRPTLFSSLLSVAKRNHYHGAKRLSFFEIANLYRKPASSADPGEELHLSVLISGMWKEKSWSDPERLATYYDLKGVLERLFALAGVPSLRNEAVSKSFLKESCAENWFSGSHLLGFSGEIRSEHCRIWDLDNPVFFAELSIPKLAKSAGEIKKVVELQKYPAVERDISLVVEESTLSGTIEAAIRERGGALVRRVELFDLFRGGRIPKGYKNLAFRVTYQSPDRTLVSDEVHTLHTRLAQEISSQFHATFQ